MSSTNELGIPEVENKQALPEGSPDKNLLDNYVAKERATELIKNAKKESFEKGRTAALAEFNANSAAAPANMASTMPMAGDNMDTLLDAKIRAKLREQEHAVAANQVAQQFTGKITAAKSKIPDIEESTMLLDLAGKNAGMAYLLNMVDNTADLIHDLRHNPSKAANLSAIMNINPQLAFQEVQKLSDSIKKNQNALGMKQPNTPLDQLEPTDASLNNGSSSIANATVTELRKKYRA